MSATSESDPTASEKSAKEHYRRALEDTIAEDNFSADATRARVARFERQARSMTRSNSYSPSSESLESVSARDPLYRPALNRVQYSGKSRTKRFEIGAVLGKGASGQVFAARDLMLDRNVAIKVLYPDIASDPVRLERFINEARITAKLEHPYILPVYDLEAPEDGSAYFSMRVAKGMSLGEALRRAAGGDAPKQVATIRDRITVFLKVLDALAFAHNQGVIHQDVKPDNIMLGEYGEVLVVDWGTAIIREGQENRKDRLIGTPVYMSPEQARRECADERSDIYGLGATLFQMLTLRYAAWHADPDEFWKKKRDGVIDPPTPEERAAAPIALLEIAMKALAAQQAGRYQKVSELGDAIAEYLQHAESINLQVSARETLERAVEQQDYALFNQALFGFQQALKYWSGNETAARALSETKLQYGECALRKNDLELAGSALNAADPSHEKTLRKLAVIRVQRARTRRRVRMVQSVAASFAVLLIGAAGYFAYDYFRYFGQWKVIYNQDFTNKSADVKSLFFSTLDWNVDRQPDAVPQPKPAGLDISGGSLVWLRDLRLHGDMRVEVQMRWPKTIDGFELFMNASHTQEFSPYLSPAGYTCQFGGYNNTLNFIAPQAHCGTTNRASAVAYEFKPGQVYKLAFQCDGEELSIWVDGKQIHKQILLLPVTRTGFDCLGFRSWEHSELLSLTISRKTIPEKSSPLVAGDSLYKAGLHEAALQVYRELATDFARQPIGEQALARAYLMTYADTDIAKVADLRSDIRTQMLSQYPDSAYWSEIFEADCIAAWRAHNYADAVATLPIIFRRDPDTRIILRLLEDGHTELPPEIGNTILAFAARTTNVFYLYLDGLGLHSLAPIANMKLTRIDCANNALTSLEPLRGMPLKAIDIGRNNVTDLEPLRGMPVTMLECSRNRIRSLSPVAGMPLWKLNCAENELATIESLHGMPLTQFICTRNEIADLTPLTGLPIGILRCEDNKIEDLAALKNMPLSEFLCDNNRIKSLEPLRDSSVSRLHCSFNKISDLSPLEHTRLSELVIDNNEIVELQPLRTVPLAILSCKTNKIRSLEPLRGTKISILGVTGNPISDLTPLSGLPLNELDISETTVTSLEALKGLSLTKLKLNSLAVTELSPLNGMKLSDLSLENTKIHSLANFDDAPPVHVLADWNNWDDTSFELLMKKWEHNAVEPKTIYRARAARAVQMKQYDLLKPMATTFNGHHYLLCPTLNPYAAAQDIAQRAGGHLVTLGSPAEEHTLLSFLFPVEDGWIGLNCGPSGEAWVTGEPVTYHNNSLSERLRPGGRVMFVVKNDPHWILTNVEDAHMSFIEWDN